MRTPTSLPDLRARRGLTTDLVLGIDASTTAVKAIVWDEHGAEIARGTAPVALNNPEPLGWEQDAEWWWTATVSAVRDVVAQVDIKRLAGLCVTHQRETVVVTDRSGSPLAPALVWMDDRCRVQVEEVRRAFDADWVHQASGKPLSTTPSLYKIRWLRQARPEVFERPHRVLDVGAFLVARLCGRFATSTASADPMGMVAMTDTTWSAELTAIAGVTVAELPELVQPGQVIGEVTPSAAKVSGLPAGMPIISGAGDGQAAGLGAGITTPERAYLNLGTALVSGVCSTEYRTDSAFRTLFGAIPGTFFLETDLKGGAFTVNWLLQLLDDGRPQGERLVELEERAAALPVGSEGLLLLPYWCGVMNPYWDDDASGAILGLRGHHDATHLYRAVLEGLALEQRLHTEQVERAIGSRIDQLVVVGGGAQSDLWCQIVADVCGKPVDRASTTEATALGAGIIAAVGCGLHADFRSAVLAMTRLGERFDPGHDEARYEALFEVYRDLYPTTRDLAHKLAELSGGTSKGND